MDFGALPPEVNSGRMYVGAGSGPLLAAAAAWDALGAELYSFAAAYTSTIAGLTVGSWLGPAATRAGRDAGQARRRGLRDRVRGDGAAAGDRRQPQPADDPDRHQHPGPEHRGHRGGRGGVRRDVGPGCGGDVRLRRRVGGSHRADALHRTAADHRIVRGGKAIRRSRAERRVGPPGPAVDPDRRDAHHAARPGDDPFGGGGDAGGVDHRGHLSDHGRAAALFRRRHRRLQPDRGDHPARRVVAAVPAGAGSGPKRAGRRRTAGWRQSHRGWAVAAGAAAGRLRLGGDPRRRRRGRVDGPLDPGRFPVGAAGLDHGRPRPEDGYVGAAGRELGKAVFGEMAAASLAGRALAGTVGNGTTGAATAAAADGAATTATIIVVPAD